MSTLGACLCVCVWNSPVGVNIKDENHSAQHQSQRAHNQHGDLPAHPFSHESNHYSFCTTCISSYSLINSCACKTGASVREKTVKAIQISASP